MKLSIYMTKRETILGFAYLIIQFMILPLVISGAIALFSLDFTEGQLNLLYYIINFSAVAVIFRKFLWQNLERMSANPPRFFWGVLLGLGRYLVMNTLLAMALLEIAPDFVNANDTAIAEMVRTELPLIATGTILLVPLAEESLFRGLIFGNLYKKTPVMAYVISTVAFSAVHIVSYIGVYSPLEMLVSFLSYLPAGICLGWAYVRADSIFAPIMIHAAVNAMGIYGMR